MLFFLRKGLSNPQIAGRRATSNDAVKYHVSNMLGKLDLTSRVELAAWTGRPALPVPRGGSAVMHAIAHVPLFYVDHLATSIAFYRDALDFEVARIQPAEEQGASAGLVNGDARLVLHERGWHDELQRGERPPDAADRVRGEAKDNVLMLFVDDPKPFA